METPQDYFTCTSRLSQVSDWYVGLSWHCRRSVHEEHLWRWLFHLIVTFIRLQSLIAFCLPRCYFGRGVSVWAQSFVEHLSGTKGSARWLHSIRAPLIEDCWNHSDVMLHCAPCVSLSDALWRSACANWFSWTLALRLGDWLPVSFLWLRSGCEILEYCCWDKFVHGILM